MSNEFRLNIGPTTSQWRGIWELTRAMKKAGFRHKASSNGSTKIISDDPLVDKWNGTMTTLNSGSAASITTVTDHPYGKLLTLTGLTGLLSPNTSGGRSEGNYITLSGSATSDNNGNWQIYNVISSTSCQVLNTNASPAVDNSGAITWVEKDAASEVYGTGTTVTDSTYAWIVLEGPETLQLSFTAAPSGTFIRGEVVTQTGSGATGECVGYIYSSTSTLGWMIVSPRTGLFNNSGTLTGSWSGATASPTALYRFRRQHCFVKNASSTLTGGSWYQCVREDTESADFFSTLANNAACTATVPPGGSTTAGNRFPAGNNSYVVRATNNSTNDGATALSLTDGHYDKTVEGRNQSSSAYCNGRIHIGVASAIPKSGFSADGSWYIFHGNTNITLANGIGTLLHFCKVEISEPGEPELYYHFANTRSDIFSRNRCYSDYVNGGGNTQGFGANSIYITSHDFSGAGSTATSFRAIGGRSVGTSGTLNFYYCPPHVLSKVNSNVGDYPPAFFPVSQTNTNPYRQLNNPKTIPPLYKEHVFIGSPPYNNICGKSKWLMVANIGNTFDKLENNYFCVSPFTPGVFSVPVFAIYIGPIDPNTTLYQI
jgi:hypothetical protein